MEMDDGPVMDDNLPFKYCDDNEILETFTIKSRTRNKQIKR